MIGGNGADVVKGSISEFSDLLVGAATQFDANDAALRSILAKWTSENDYATRVASLTTGPVAFDETTVIPDSDVDELFGRDGRDWFIIGSENNVNGQEEGVFTRSSEGYLGRRKPYQGSVIVRCLTSKSTGDAQALQKHTLG